MHPKNIFHICCMFLAGFLTVLGCGRDAQPSAENPSHIFVVVHHEDNEAHIDFDGDALVKENSTQLVNSETKDLTFKFVAMHLPPGESFAAGGANDNPQNHVIEFAGKVTRPSENNLQLQADLFTKTPLIIRFVKMNPKGESDQDEFFEMSFSPGRHTVNFDGEITGWWMPEGAAPDTDQ